jgi:hypothetical protein
MAQPKLYLESSVISVLVARHSRDPIMADMQELTNYWWNTRRRDYDLFVSKYVIEEISNGDPEVATSRVRIAAEAGLLDVSKTTRRFARKLCRVLSLPRRAKIDAFRLAIAIEGGMDFLLTWNCAHIANPVHQPRIREMAKRKRLKMPVICSPRDFLGDTDDGTRSNSGDSRDS